MQSVCLCVCEDPQEGVVVLLPAESQQRMVQLLYFLPKMSQSLLANLSCCCTTGRISAGLAASLIRIVHFRWAWASPNTCRGHMNSWKRVFHKTLLFRKDIFDSAGMTLLLEEQIHSSGTGVGESEHSSLSPSDGSIALSDRVLAFFPWDVCNGYNTKSSLGGWNAAVVSMIVMSACASRASKHTCNSLTFLTVMDPSFPLDKETCNNYVSVRPCPQYD